MKRDEIRRRFEENSRTPRMRANNGSRLRTLISSALGAKWHTYIYVRTCKMRKMKSMP